MNTTISFPLREVNGENWLWIDKLSIDNKAIKRMDVVAYKGELKNEKLSFAGGHRHRYYVFRDSIHIRFPAFETPINIQDVKPSAQPQPQRRHDRRR